MMEETQEKIKICMFGKFSITQGQLTIDDSCNRTHQLWNLLEYLIDFRFKNVSQEELVSAIWPDGSSKNPANALRRCSQVLTDLFVYNLSMLYLREK